MTLSGRPRKLKAGTSQAKGMSKPGRFEMKIDPKIKRMAEKNLDKVGFSDLSAFMRRCFELLSNGTAQTIPQLCLENEPYERIHEQPEL